MVIISKSRLMYKKTVILQNLKFILYTKGMFGWYENSRIVAVFGIRITTVQPNANLLFRNSENS
jgi:hypothetical protein